jgi:replication fork protection complex subunit TIPIN/Csm3/Swi3
VRDQALLTINLQFSDIAWLLGTYQVWLHELFPRAKFADALAMVEKLGHTKRMQILRSGWIDESKPNPAQENDSDHENISATSHPGREINPSPQQSNLTPDVISTLAATEILPAENEVDSDTRANGQQDTDDITFVGVPDDDELDQLLAEEPLQNAIPSRNSSTSAALLNAGGSRADGEEFADEEEIMRSLGFS